MWQKGLTNEAEASLFNHLSHYQSLILEQSNDNCS